MAHVILCLLILYLCYDTRLIEEGPLNTTTSLTRLCGDLCFHVVLLIGSDRLVESTVLAKRVRVQTITS